mgnify:CR=1 FL=1
MKKITFLIAFVFCGINLYAQDTCNTAITVSAGLHTIDAINGTEIPLPVCSTNGEGATSGECYPYPPTQHS